MEDLLLNAVQAREAYVAGEQLSICIKEASFNLFGEHVIANDIWIAFIEACSKLLETK